MANNYALKELKYKHTNGTVEDVKGLNIDGYQWRKPYDLTVSSIPEGVGTVTIQRTETESNCNQLPQPTPSTPIKMVYSEPITVEDIVLHGDKLSVSATPADEGYNSPEVSFESGVAFGQVVNNVNVTVQSGGGKTFYVQYNQGNADNGNNLPTENPQPRVYPNGVSVRSNLLPKATQSDPSYTVTYTRDDLAHSGPTSDWAQTSYDVTTYQPDGWTTNAAEYNNCEYASGDIIGKDVIGTINLYPNFDVTTTNSGVVVSDYVFERNSNETTSGGNTLTVKYNQGFATSGTIPAIQTATGGATINTTSYFQDGWNDENMDHYEAGENTGPLTQNLVLTPTWGEDTVTSTTPAPSVTVATNNMTKANVQTDGCSVTYKKGSSGSVNGLLPGSPDLDASQSSIVTKDTTSYTASGWTTDSSSPAGGPDLTDKVSNGTTITATSGNKTVNLYPRFIPTTTSGSAVIGENVLIKSNDLTPSYTVSYEKGVWDSDVTGTCPEVQFSSMRTTYSPNGWTTTDGSTTRIYADGVTINPLVEDLVLYPCFTSNTTNTGVTTAANCFSKPSTVLGTQTITFEHDGTTGTLPLPQSIDECASYTQSGWSVSNKGRTKDYIEGQSTGALSQDLVLYPYFETRTYTVPPSRLIRLPSASSCLTKLDTPISSTIYTVTLDYSGNYAGNSQANEVITVSPTQSYTVSGWTKTKGGTKDYDDYEDINLNSSFTLYPYIKKASTINQPVIDLSTLIPEDRPGYTFLGWSKTVGTTATPLQQLLVTGNTTLYAIWELMSVQVTFVSTNAIWSQDTLWVPLNTTYSISGNTITFTTPANPTSTTTSVTCAPSLGTTIDATFENNTYGSWDSTEAVKLRLTYSSPTISTSGGSGGNKIGTGGLLVSGESTLQYPTITNSLAGTAGTNSAYSGARTWKISGTNWKSQAFSRTFTTNSHNSQYYYDITRNFASTLLLGSTNFKPTVTRSTHTYTVSYPAMPTGISEYHIRQIAADGSITTLVTKPTSAGTLTVNYGTQLCVGAIAATGYTTPVVTGISSNAATPTTVTSNVTIGITTQQLATEEWQTIFEGSAGVNVRKNDSSGTVTLSTSGLTGIWPTNATKVRFTLNVNTGGALLGGETYTTTITNSDTLTYDAATNSYSFRAQHSASRAGTTNYHTVAINKLTPTTFNYSTSWMNGSVMLTVQVTKIELFAPVA